MSDGLIHLDAAKEELVRLHLKISWLKEQLADAMRRLGGAKDEYAYCRKRLDDSNAENEGLKEQLATLQKALADRERALKRCNVFLDQALKDEAEALAELAEMQGRRRL